MAGNANSGGRNAKAIDRHRAAGTYRGDRHGGIETPEPPKGRPVPPNKLPREAQREWDRMVLRMEQAQTSSIVDDAALFQYVLLHAETEQIRADNRRLRSLIKKFGHEAKELEGEDRRQLLAQVIELHRIVANHATQLRQGHMALRQYLVEFGMTPAARTRVKIPATKKAKSKLEEFMGAGATVHSPAKVQ